MLPLAVLSQTDNPASILEQVARKIETIEDKTQQSNLAATSAILAGLILDKMLIKKLLREEIMKESVMYQQIKSEGKAEGIAEGKAEGKAEGIEQGRQQEANLILKQLNKRLGEIPEELSQPIRNLSVEQLENLGEALLDFQTLSDLSNWLQ